MPRRSQGERTIRERRCVRVQNGGDIGQRWRGLQYDDCGASVGPSVRKSPIGPIGRCLAEEKAETVATLRLLTEPFKSSRR
jgi:hypothetical protein